MLYLLYIAKSASKPPEYNTKESCWNIFLAYISFSSSYPRQALPSAAQTTRTVFKATRDVVGDVWSSFFWLVYYLLRTQAAQLKSVLWWWQGGGAAEMVWRLSASSPSGLQQSGSFPSWRPGLPSPPPRWSSQRLLLLQKLKHSTGVKEKIILYWGGLFCGLWTFFLWFILRLLTSLGNSSGLEVSSVG